MRILILNTLLILAANIVFAQSPSMQDRRMNQHRKEQLKMLRIWKMTEELDLSENQADKFFPRLRDEDNKIEDLENERQEMFNELNQQAKEGGLDPNELDRKIDKITDIETNIIRKRAEFVKGMDGVLTTDQRAKLMVFRYRFRERMENMMREMRRNRPMQGKRQKNDKVDKMKNVYGIVVIAIMILTLSVGTLAEGKREGCGDDRSMRHEIFMMQHAEKLGLSEEQTEKLKNYLYDMKKKEIASEAEIKIANLDFRKMMMDDASEKDLNKQADKIAKKMADKRKLHISAHMKMKSTLTPEQWKNMKKIMRSGMKKQKHGMKKKMPKLQEIK